MTTPTLLEAAKAALNVLENHTMQRTFAGGVLIGEACIALRAAIEAAEKAESVATPFVLKGVGKVNGDGWKDTTRIGEVVYVWNTELPEPYKPGQYPRIGSPGWSASTDQYEFIPATVEEASSAVESLIGDLKCQIDRRGHRAAGAKHWSRSRACAPQREREQMTDAEINSLRALMRSATPGPLTVMARHHGVQCVAVVGKLELAPPNSVELAHERADADFLAAAVNALLGEVERLRADAARSAELTRKVAVLWDALWKASGDHELHVAANLESVGGDIADFLDAAIDAAMEEQQQRSPPG